MKSIVCGLSLLWACLPAYAQTSYPSRVVTLVNPFAPGASTDVVARIIAQKLSEEIKRAGFGPVRLEGMAAADWVVIDAGDVIVHLFRPEVRTFYNLERMWAFGDTPPVGNA